MANENKSKMPEVRFHRTTRVFAGAKCRKIQARAETSGGIRFGLCQLIKRPDSIDRSISALAGGVGPHRA
ncbi:hypothetical protein NKJ74_20305 [Mesorhizobium sp. M0046]|uniref:hypothetical protein n=1 Tax=Mesorhizobium sp. M0046 TaxID=2956858 RepID=UPI00333B27E7